MEFVGDGAGVEDDGGVGGVGGVVAPCCEVEPKVVSDGDGERGELGGVVDGGAVSGDAGVGITEAGGSQSLI